MSNNSRCVAERLGKLRDEIYALEKELAQFGFDIRRGVESYKVSELKRFLAKSKNKRRVKSLLLKLIELHELLYLELYNLAGLKRMNVDTDTPEKRLMMLKEWLITGKTTSLTPRETKFKSALRSVAEVLEQCRDDCEVKIYEVLVRVYKRDYDRYRVAKWVLDLCTSFDGTHVDEPGNLESIPVRDLSKKIAECAQTIGKEKLARLIIVRGTRGNA